MKLSILLLFVTCSQCMVGYKHNEWISCEKQCQVGRNCDNILYSFIKMEYEVKTTPLRWRQETTRKFDDTADLQCLQIYNKESAGETHQSADVMHVWDKGLEYIKINFESNPLYGIDYKVIKYTTKT